MELSFSEFKEQFYSRINDMSVFDCEEFNLLKVVLDGLKVDYVKKGILQKPIFENRIITPVTFFLKRLKYKQQMNAAELALEKIRSNGSLNKKYIILDQKRTTRDEQGHETSYYFGNVKAFLGKDQFLLISEFKTKLEADLVYSDLNYLKNKPFTKDDLSLIDSLKKTFSNIKAQINYSEQELENIQIAINHFFFEYRLWTEILKDTKAKCFLYNTHYHKEGVLLAFKRKHIRLVEFQHGLIAKEDIFYVFPEKIKSVAHKALFSDKIFTYGKYWSEILQTGFEYPAEKPDIIGQYQVQNLYVEPVQKNELDNFLNGNAFILFTTQTFLHDYFITYISWLAGDLKQKQSLVKLVVKLHPAEKPEAYQALKSFENVKIINCNTEYLLSTCSWHVSIYSTTLYDATKYGCLNYSLNVEQYWDYVEAFVSSGVSTLLEKDQNPTELFNTAQKINPGYFYENFDTHKHKLLSL